MSKVVCDRPGRADQGTWRRPAFEPVALQRKQWDGPEGRSLAAVKAGGAGAVAVDQAGLQAVMGRVCAKLMSRPGLACLCDGGFYGGFHGGFHGGFYGGFHGGFHGASHVVFTASSRWLPALLK